MFSDADVSALRALKPLHAVAAMDENLRQLMPIDKMQ